MQKDISLSGLETYRMGSTHGMRNIFLAKQGTGPFMETKMGSVLYFDHSRF
jgi:hypothetical protein